MGQPSLGFGAKLAWDFSHGGFPNRTTDSESVAQHFSSWPLNVKDKKNTSQRFVLPRWRVAEEMFGEAIHYVEMGAGGLNDEGNAGAGRIPVRTS